MLYDLTTFAGLFRLLTNQRHRCPSPPTPSRFLRNTWKCSVDGHFSDAGECFYCGTPG